MVNGFINVYTHLGSSSVSITLYIFRRNSTFVARRSFVCAFSGPGKWISMPLLLVPKPNASQMRAFVVRFCLSTQIVVLAPWPACCGSFPLRRAGRGGEFMQKYCFHLFLSHVHNLPILSSVCVHDSRKESGKLQQCFVA